MEKNRRALGGRSLGSLKGGLMGLGRKEPTVAPAALVVCCLLLVFPVIALARECVVVFPLLGLPRSQSECRAEWALHYEISCCVCVCVGVFVCGLYQNSTTQYSQNGPLKILLPHQIRITNV